MKFKLGNSRQYIEVEMVYTITKLSEETEYFICTPDILQEYSLTATQFIAFLKQELPKEDPSYGPAFELWVCNRGIYSKRSLRDMSKADIDDVNKIITADGVINLK